MAIPGFLGIYFVVYRTGTKPPTAVGKAGEIGLAAGLIRPASPKFVTDEFSSFSKLGDGIHNIASLIPLRMKFAIRGRTTISRSVSESDQQA
jgi:hypothetical protein